MRTRSITNLERALARAGSDADFRAQVLEDGRAAQVAYRLFDAEWHCLLRVVKQIERGLVDDPPMPTALDHGRPDRPGDEVTASREVRP